VATGFPSGQTSLSVRLQEIREAVAFGAKEIDIVINRRHALAGDWEALYSELVDMREAVGDGAIMKAILAVGELPSYTAVYQVSPLIIN
jgi:deoxyribose-phosphate aldolase